MYTRHYEQLEVTVYKLSFWHRISSIASATFYRKYVHITVIV